MKLLEVTYTVTVPDGFPESLCAEARAQYGFSLEKNRRRMEAVTMGLRHFHPELRQAKLEISLNVPVEYRKGATAKRIAETKGRGKTQAASEE